MRKILSILLCLIICLVFGCTDSNKKNSDVSDDVPSVGVITIHDNTFVSQANDIYKNPKNYEDKIIIVQGIYTTNTVENKVHHYVIRSTKDTEGKDTTIGFEFKYDGDFPKENDWIEVLGSVESLTGADGEKSVILDATRIEIMKTRGRVVV